MKLRYLLAVSLLPIMASCSKAPEATPAAAAPAPAPVAEAPATPPQTPPPAAPEPAAEPAAAEPASPSPSPPSGLVAGQDYQLIAGGQPFQPVSGKIEVVEMFNYACPACNAFNPFLDAWKKKLPADVHMVYLPVEFRPDFLQYARAYFAAESLGLVEKTHDAVYAAVHDQHSLPGEGSPPDEAKIAAFYARYGANAEQFQQLMDSFSVSIQIAKAKQFGMRSQVTSTPSLVINGKYLIKGKSWEDMLRIADQLIAHERAG